MSRIRRWLVRPLVWLLVLVLVCLAGGWLYLTSDAFERRLETLVEERASETLGRPVTIEDLDIDLLSLTATARDVRVAGPTPDDPPVLTARRVEVAVSILALAGWGGQGTAIRLDRLSVEEPRFELRYDPDGTSDLPRFSTGGEGEGVRVELAHLHVERGVFVYGDRRVPLDLDAREVAGELEGGTFDTDHPYRIRLTAGSMETRLLELPPFTPAVRLEARLYPDRLDLTAGRLTAPDFEADLSGAVRWREPEEVEIEIGACGAASWANRLGFLEPPIEGPVRFDGRFSWNPERWSYGGEVGSEHLDLLGRRFEQVRGTVAGDRDGVRVEVAQAHHASGTVRGTLTVDLSGGSGAGRPARVEARAEGLALRRVLDDLGFDLQGVAGRLTGTLDYRFSTAAIWEGSGDGKISARGLRRPTDRLALRGDAAFAIARGVLRTRGAQLSAASQSADVDLIYDLEHRTGAVRYRLDTGDLGELASMLPGELQPRSGAVPPWWPQTGRGTLAGTLDLAPDRIVGRVSFDLAEVSAGSEVSAGPGAGVSDLVVDRIEGSFEHTPRGLENLEVRADRGGGELWLTGRVALPDSSERAAALEVELIAADWPLATAHALLPSLPDLEGGLNGQASLSGPLDRPEMQVSAWAEPVRLGSLAVDRAEADLSWSGQVLRLERLRLSGAPGELGGRGTVDFDSGSLDLHLDAPELVLEKSQNLESLAARLSGKVGATATVGGTLENPTAELRLAGRALALDGRPLGRQGTADVVATWGDGRVRAEGSLLGLVHFEGGGSLDRDALSLDLRVESRQIGEIVELAMEPAPPIGGSLAGTLAVRGSWNDPASLRGRLELSELELRYDDRPIHNLEPVVAELAEGSLDIESLYLGNDPGNDKTGSELFVAGTVGLAADDPPLDLRLQSSLGAAWLQPFLPAIDLGGSFDVLATVRGTLEAPEINGEGEIRDGTALLSGFPHSLENVSAVVFFYPDEVVLHDLTARFASGRVRATGRMEMPREGEPLSYEIQTEAKDLTVRYPEGWTLRGGAEVTLRSTEGGEGREILGTVRLDRAFYVQDVPVGLFQVFQTALQRQRLVLQETDELLASTHLSVAVQGDDALQVRNNVADLSGDLALSVQGTLARPLIFGQVELQRGGKLDFRDTKYTVERGLVTFSNPYEIEPVIDLTATTEVRHYDIRLMLSGTLDRLNANFSSDPPLADLEILGLLTTGAAPGQSIEAQFGAERFLFGQAASAISRRVNTLFGFDRFQISPGQGDEVASGIGVTLEKRLSSDVRVIFSRDPASAEREILQVAWDVTDKVTLILTSEGDGSYALDARLEKSF